MGSKVSSTPLPTLIQLTQEEYEEVVRRVGRMVINLPMVSGLLGHQTALSTIQGNYLSFSGEETKIERIAKEFFNDLFQLKTSEMCMKWYGDPIGETIRRTMKVIA